MLTYQRDPLVFIVYLNTQAINPQGGFIICTYKIRATSLRGQQVKDISLWR